MYTIDASVWVNAFDPLEAGPPRGYPDSRQLLDLLVARGLPIIVPILAPIEVAAAFGRMRRDAVQAEAFAEAVEQLPNVTVMVVDDLLARLAVALAAQHGLRGADAVYAAVAAHAGCTLVTLDREQLNRLAGAVPTRTPAAALAELAE